MNEPRRREVNSLLNYSAEDVVFEKDYDAEENDNRNDNHGRKNNHDSYHHDDNRKDKNGKNKTPMNPVYKIICNETYYDKPQIYKALVKQDGLYLMIRDLKNWIKNPKKERRPDYIRNCLKDIVVAAALPDAIDDVLKNEKYELKKKDFEPLMNEIVMVIRSTTDDSERFNDNGRENLIRKYGKDSVEAMREAYISILYKLNKKKIKKFKEIDLDEAVSKKLIVLTAGSPHITVYQLLKYMYNNANKFSMSTKTFLKILKICYGKDNMSEVMTCIMNEKVNTFQSNPFNKMESSNRGESEIWVLVDQAMREYLERMPTKDLKKTILNYVKERKTSRKRGDNVRRRFGDRRTIHPDDYPKLTRVLETLERDDFSIIEYLR